MNVDLKKTLGEALSGLQRLRDSLHGQAKLRVKKAIAELEIREAEIFSHASQLEEQPAIRNTQITDFLPKLLGPIKNNLSNENHSLADALAQDLAQNKDRIAIALTVSSAAGNGLRSALKPISEQLFKLISIEGVAENDKRALKFLSLKLRTVPFSLHEKELNNVQTIELLSRIHENMTKVVDALTTNELENEMLANAKTFEHALSVVASGTILQRIKELKETSENLAEVNDKLGQQLKDIENFKEASKRCIETIRLIGSIFSLIAVI